jgi:hypothetical protein
MIQTNVLDKNDPNSFDSKGTKYKKGEIYNHFFLVKKGGIALI